MGFSLAEAIVYFKGDDKQLESDLDSAEKKTQSSAGEMAKFLGGAIVGGAAIAGAAIIGIGTEAFNVASDIDAATDQIGASLGLTDEQAKKFGTTIKQVYGDNWGNSIEDVGTAIETVAKQLHLTADDPALTKITENAFRLRDAFGVDVGQSIDSVKTLMDNFGLSSQEAFDMVSAGFQRGLDRSGDFLDTINEYSTQFETSGFSAEQFFSILETGSQGGVLGTDKIADAIKEMGLRLNGAGTPVKQAFDAMGLSFDEIAGKVSSGQANWADYFDIITGGLTKISDPIARSQAQVAIFGTQAEDLGTAFTEFVYSANSSLEDFAGSTDKIDAKYTNLGSVMEGMWRQFQVGIAPAGEAILGFVNENLPAFQGAVNTVSGIVVTAIGYIPLAVSAMQVAWDTDWGKMRTTLNTFTSEVPGQLSIFWTEVQRIFSVGQGEVEVNWDLLWGYNLLASWTGFINLVIANATEFTRALNGIFQALYSLVNRDWAGFWGGLEKVANAVVDAMLNMLEYAWGPGFRDWLATGLQMGWDKMIEMWGYISAWFASTFGTLSSWIMPHIETPTGGGGSGGFGSNPIQGAIDAINGSQGFGQAVGQSSVGNITLNQHFHGQADSRTVKDATSDGVLNASRRLGLR